MGREEKINDDWYEYHCECGRNTEYGITRHSANYKWGIDSCCGNCNSANDIKFCPFCGNKIRVQNRKK